ncbi:MAG: transglutaminaseTgpA domain-containing protein [Acidobacteriota bacterium]
MNRPSGRRGPTRVGLPRPTGIAWGLGLMGLALLGAAVNTGNNLLYLLFGLLVAALPVSLVMSMLNLVRLAVTVRLPPVPRAGVPFRVELTVRNDRRRLAARSLRLLVVTRRGIWGPALIETVDAGEACRVAITVRDAGRGPQHLLGVRVVTTFPLGFLRRRRFYPWPDELLVMPAPAAARVAIGATRGETGAAGQTRHAAGTEFDGLRRGRDEDDTRRIDWKATARSGALMVRESSGEGRPVLHLSLGTRRLEVPRLRARVAFEGEVSRLAGQARPVLLGGGVVHLSIDRRPQTFSGLSGWSGLQRRLARLVPTDAGGQPLPDSPTPRRAPRPCATRVRDLPSGRAHAGSAVMALAVSSAALFAYGGIGPVAFLLLVGAMVAARFSSVPRRLERTAFRHVWRASAVGALVFYILDLLFWHHNPLTASLALIVFITLYKLFNSHSLSDDRQVLLVSLLQIVLAAALTTSVTFVLALLAWLMAAVHAQIAWTALPAAAGDATRPVRLTRSRNRWRYRRPTFTVTASLLTCATVIFLVVPHLGTGAFAPGALGGGAISGFSETTRLGDIGRIKLNRARVMDVGLDGPVPAGVALKWRGLALDHFDGRTWSRTGDDLAWVTADMSGHFDTSGQRRGPRTVPPGDDDDGPTLDQTIRLEPGQGRVMFALPSADAVESTDLNFLARDGAGSLLFPRPLRRRTSYVVHSHPPDTDPALLRRASGAETDALRRRYLELPPIDARVFELAHRLTDDAASRYDAAARLETWLAANRRYSLDVDDAGRADPLSAFLFDDMPAHCEYFATSMVVLARAAGIPARYVAGYLRGEKNRFSNRFTVRQSDAHAWVEVHFPSVGWVPFDPTPAAGQGSWPDQGLAQGIFDAYSTLARWWDDYVIGIDLDDQARGFLALRATLGGAFTDVAATLRATRAAPAVWLLVVALAAVLFAWRSRASLWHLAGRKHSTPTISRAAPLFYRRLLRVLARSGLRRREGETPAEFAHRSAPRLTARAGARLRDVTDLYYRLRFDRTADLRHGARLGRRLLADIRRELRRRGVHTSR